MNSFLRSLDSLPRQTAVFVVYDLREKKVHVLSLCTKVRYSVVRSLREGESLDEEVDREVERIFRASPIYGKTDEASFYNGVSGDELWRLIIPEAEQARVLDHQRYLLDLQKRHLEKESEEFRRSYGEPRLSAFTAVPYDFHPLDERIVRETIGDVGTDEPFEKTVGGIDLVVDSIPGMPFGASFKQNAHGRFVTVKLDRPVCLFEIELSDGTVVPETDLACFIEDETLAAIRANAPELLQTLWAKLYEDRRHPLIDAKNWTVETHEHVEV